MTNLLNMGYRVRHGATHIYEPDELELEFQMEVLNDRALPALEVLLAHIKEQDPYAATRAGQLAQNVREEFFALRAVVCNSNRMVMKELHDQIDRKDALVKQLQRQLRDERKANKRKAHGK